ADLVLLAMGFTGADPAGLLDDLGVDMDSRGNVARDGGYATSVPGVFGAGAIGGGASPMAWGLAPWPSADAPRGAYPTGSSATPRPATARTPELPRLSPSPRGYECESGCCSLHTKRTFMTCRLREAGASMSAGAPGGVQPGASRLALDVGVIGCYPGSVLRRW